MKEKIKNQKGFIPIIFIIIGAVVVASAAFSVVKYKDEITANISKVFKPKIEIPNIESTGRDETAEEPIIEEESGIEEKQDGAQKLQEQLKIAEQKRLEAEKRLAEEKARQETEKAKAEAERLKADQELQRQLEAQRLAEEQRQKEIARQQELERQRQLEEQRQKELELQQAINQLKNLFVQKLNEYNSQLSSLNEQILAKENEINSIIAEYDKKIEDNRNKPILWSLIIGREANLIRERNEKLEPLYRELQSLENQYNRLVGSPIISNPYSYSISNNYWQFTPSGNGGILSDSLGNYYQVTYYPDGSFIISP